MVDPLALPSNEAVGALSALSEGMDPMALLAELEEAGRVPDLGTRPGVPIPGESEALQIDLTPDQETLLVSEICDLLDEYDAAVREKHATDDEIEDFYSLRADPGAGGSHPSSARMVSELLFSTVDQSAARIITNMMNAEPLFAVDPVAAADASWLAAEQIAKEAQSFLNSYVLETVDFRHLLPVSLHRTAKIGTAVLYSTWEEQRRVRYAWGEGGRAERVEEKIGRVKCDLLDNKDVKVWPPNLINWQRGYVFVGHEATLTPAEWRDAAARYGLTAEEAEILRLDPVQSPTPQAESAARAGIQTTTLEQRDLLQPVRIFEGWCHMTLPGKTHPDKFQVVLHRGQRRLLWIGYNAFHSQHHPYFPIRYKCSDKLAWGIGAGHEVLQNQAADCALWNLELDNLYAGAYWAILRRAGSIYDTQANDPRPGMQIPVDDVDKDFKPIKLGGDAPEIGSSRTQNQSRAATASGLSSVMFGQGDPTMKSGAGTGSTLALIEQGNKKLGLIDHYIRTDVSALVEHIFELVVQFGQEGIFYQHVDEEGSNKLRRLLYTPPRGDVRSMFRFRVQAPSANTTDEARKQAYMLIWTFALQHVQVIERYVLEILQETNPAAINAWRHLVVAYVNQIARKVIEFNDMPGVAELIPEIPQPSGPDQQINFLMQQNQELQGQLEQALATLEQLSGQGMNMAMAGGGAAEGVPDVEPS